MGQSTDKLEPPLPLVGGSPPQADFFRCFFRLEGFFSPPCSGHFENKGGDSSLSVDIRAQGRTGVDEQRLIASIHRLVKSARQVKINRNLYLCGQPKDTFLVLNCDFIIKLLQCLVPHKFGCVPWPEHLRVKNHQRGISLIRGRSRWRKLGSWHHHKFPLPWSNTADANLIFESKHLLLCRIFRKLSSRCKKWSVEFQPKTRFGK